MQQEGRRLLGGLESVAGQQFGRVLKLYAGYEAEKESSYYVLYKIRIPSLTEDPKPNIAELLERTERPKPVITRGIVSQRAKMFENKVGGSTISRDFDNHIRILIFSHSDCPKRVGAGEDAIS